MTRLGDDADLPFEESPRTPLTDKNVQISGSIVIIATDGVDVPMSGRKPALLFRFTDPFGCFYPPTLLILDDEQMAKLPKLVADACATARRAIGG